jgi:hypothetical protein
MNTFTIDPDNNITVLIGDPAGAANLETFSTAKELAKLTADWPISRLVDTWNSFAGVTPFDDLKPVKKFTKRSSATARIWEAVARLLPGAAQPSDRVAPAKAKSGKKASPAKKAPKSAKRTKEAKPLARDGSKTAKVLDLLKRSGGVTGKELIKATGWQPHSVRGFLSGTVGKKMGLTVVSTKGKDAVRCYSIKA